MKNATLYMDNSAVLEWVTAGALYLSHAEDSEEATELAEDIIEQYKNLWTEAFEAKGYVVEFSSELASSWIDAESEEDEVDINDLWERTIGHLSYDEAEAELDKLRELIKG